MQNSVCNNNHKTGELPLKNPSVELFFLNAAIGATIRPVAADNRLALKDRAPLLKPLVRLLDCDAKRCSCNKDKESTTIRGY